MLLDQGRVTLDELRAGANRPGVEALERLGFNAATVTSDLETALARASAAEADQERAKAAYLTEADEDRALAEQGYRWVQRLQARVRLYGAGNPEASAYEYRSLFRFGQLRAARARSVVYELHRIPEAEAQKAKLAAVGSTTGSSPRRRRSGPTRGWPAETLARANRERYRAVGG